ncbi:MAG TPA: alpha-hydroxy acid oxidase [Nocardioidaceae bacterium]|nr:alpha-hydroxy acid oxidase [Nocardioidaceae bacterium]
MRRLRPPSGRWTGGRFVDGLEERAAEVLPEPVFRYLCQGAREGVSAAEATAAWDRFRFTPRVLRDVTDVRTGTSLLGTEVATPIALAPTTLQRAAHPEGEIATARAAAAAGALMVVSSNAGSTFEDIATTGVDWWIQLYVMAERQTGLPLLERAVAAGAKAVVLTVDTPVVGTKYGGAGPSVWEVAEPGWVRANFPPGYGGSPGDEKATDLGPHDIDWLSKTTGLPVVVKGVLRPSDARRCLDAGAAAVWVSNHGGRQLDYTAATADMLAAVVAEVGGSSEVYVDGGVRAARHVVTALALGARAVFLGRLPLYAVAVDGADGVRRMFGDLDEELIDALTLAGCPSVTDVPPGILAPPLRDR